jgi:hypothetical protein
VNGLLGAGALLEEVCHWGCTFERFALPCILAHACTPGYLGGEGNRF